MILFWVISPKNSKTDATGNDLGEALAVKQKRTKSKSKGTSRALKKMMLKGYQVGQSYLYG
jgi:hypothetical protein